MNINKKDVPVIASNDILIKTTKGKWYFCVDETGVPFAESKGYKTLQEALKAMIGNYIKWVFISSD